MAEHSDQHSHSLAEKADWGPISRPFPVMPPVRLAAVHTGQFLPVTAARHSARVLGFRMWVRVGLELGFAFTSTYCYNEIVEPLYDITLLRDMSFCPLYGDVGDLSDILFAVSLALLTNTEGRFTTESHRNAHPCIAILH